MKLKWQPQESYKEYFLNTPREIFENRSVFRPDIEYFIARGGRGSAKTWTFADAVVVEASIRPVRILVTRETQGSIDESIKAEIEEAIHARGLSDFFDIQATTIIGANGSKFIFKGLRDQTVANIKSIADVDIVLCEESEAITKKSWSKLLPSIRPRDQITRGGAPIIIVIYNPDQELDDTHQRFAINPPPNSVSKLINYYDNKYFPPHLERQRAHAQKTLPLADYEHDWLGKTRGSGDNVIIQLDWIKAARFASRHPDFKKVGKKIVGYDPAGQGKDTNACVFLDGNICSEIDEWLKSPDLREASKRAFKMPLKHRADILRYDECGGLGDGVSVFVGDEKTKHKKVLPDIQIIPFDAGDAVFWSDEPIVKIENEEDEDEGGGKTWGEMYSNAKAQSWGIWAQIFYNSYRFIVLGEDVPPEDLASLDIECDELFNKLAKELSTPLWVKSKVNSKKRVEGKEDMEKRTGQKSPNIGDGLIMTKAPYHIEEEKIALIL
jgi:phage terminase large subunit